jgi:S1-C subfamily serine protease
MGETTGETTGETAGETTGETAGETTGETADSGSRTNGDAVTPAAVARADETAATDGVDDDSSPGEACLDVAEAERVVGSAPTVTLAAARKPVAVTELSSAGRGWRGKLTLLASAAVLVASGAITGGVSAALWLDTQTPAPIVLAPWDGPNVVGTVVTRVTDSVYTVRGILHPDDGFIDRTGTAVAWRADGLLVTNHHVVGNTGIAVLQGPDGRRIDAEIVGSDERADVAVLRIPGPVAVPVWASTVPPVGALAVAVGAPFGLGGSVSAGIVSATHRSVGVVAGAALADLIQFDAAANPGNSGGPLLNAGGEVIGLVTAIYSTSGVNDGVAFALPAALVSEVAAAIVAGTWEPGYLGVLVVGLGGGDSGVLVHDVVADGAADVAGVRGGDIIVAVDGAVVRDVADLISRVSRVGRGGVVILTIERGDASVELSATLDAVPPDTQADTQDEPSDGTAGDVTPDTDPEAPAQR